MRIRSLARSAHDVRWVRRFSALGEYSGCWVALGLGGVAVARSRAARGAWLRGTVSVVAAHCASTALKSVIKRRRPAIEHLPHLMRTPTGLSFPSSHATGSFAAARAYRELLPGPALDVAAGLMAGSRVFLGVHYPSDIAAGALLGSAIGELGRRL